MDRNKLKEEFVKVLYEFTKVKDIEITEEMDLILDLKIKSAKFVDIIIIFEDRYGVEIETDEMDNMFSVGTALDVLLKSLN